MMMVAVSLLHEVTELYKNRVDKLHERHYDYMTEWVTEKFGRGRSRHLQGMYVARYTTKYTYVQRNIYFSAGKMKKHVPVTFDC